LTHQLKVLFDKFLDSADRVSLVSEILGTRYVFRLMMTVHDDHSGKREHFWMTKSTSF
jgi:hypothetical protein